MYAQFYAGRPFLGLPVVALVLFGLVFAVVIVRVLWPGAREQAIRDAALVLDDDGTRFQPATAKSVHLHGGNR